MQINSSSIDWFLTWPSSPCLFSKSLKHLEMGGNSHLLKTELKRALSGFCIRVNFPSNFCITLCFEDIFSASAPLILYSILSNCSTNICCHDLQKKKLLLQCQLKQDQSIEAHEHCWHERYNYQPTQTYWRQWQWMGWVFFADTMGKIHITRHAEHDWVTEHRRLMMTASRFSHLFCKVTQVAPSCTFSPAFIFTWAVTVMIFCWTLSCQLSSHFTKPP